MKPQYYKLPKHYHVSVNAREDIIPNFYPEWHYHDEVELVYIIKGEGTRFIGDNISRFADGDLILLGAYLPHVWKNEFKELFSAKSPKVRAIVVQFPLKIGGEEFLGTPEMAPIKRIIEDAQLGVEFTLPENHKIKRQLRKMVSQSPFDRFISLLSLLKKMTELEDKKLLSSVPFADYYQKNKSKRIDKIYDHILNNFEKEIKLDVLASIANMTTTSLCRFFKKSTRKSLSEFINEVRIGYSCKLLIGGKMTVSDVCFSCGYNNLSYFNRQFKKIMGVSPSKYQNQIPISSLD